MTKLVDRHRTRRPGVKRAIVLGWPHRAGSSLGFEKPTLRTGDLTGLIDVDSGVEPSAVDWHLDLADFCADFYLELLPIWDDARSISRALQFRSWDCTGSFSASSVLPLLELVFDAAHQVNPEELPAGSTTVAPPVSSGTLSNLAEELPPPDTTRAMAFREMAARLHEVTRPVDDPARPLPFDPDDYPFR